MITLLLLRELIWFEYHIQFKLIKVAYLWLYWNNKQNKLNNQFTIFYDFIEHIQYGKSCSEILVLNLLG